MFSETRPRNTEIRQYFQEMHDLRFIEIRYFIVYLPNDSPFSQVVYSFQDPICI